MFRMVLRAGLLVALLMFGATLSARPAMALLAGPSATDFSVTESCAANTGCAGTYTVTNNSAFYYVYSFFVTNPIANFASTGQTNWTASWGSDVCDNSSISCGSGFSYSNANGASVVSADLANDVGPGQSSANFNFSSLSLASTVTLDLADTSGDTFILQFPASDVPEPASLALLGSGLVLLAGMRRRWGLR